MRSKIAILMMVAWAAVAGSGCSIWLEESRPDFKDVNVAQVGVSRQIILHDWGMPETSYQSKDGKQVDVFKLAPDADSRGVKTTKTAFFWVADAFTLGLWEVVGTPYEVITEPALRTYVIRYKADSTIEKVESFAGSEAISQS